MPRVSIEGLKALDPVVEYKISDLDTSSDTTQYFGFTNASGN